MNKKVVTCLTVLLMIVVLGLFVIMLSSENRMFSILNFIKYRDFKTVSSSHPEALTEVELVIAGCGRFLPTDFHKEDYFEGNPYYENSIVNDSQGGVFRRPVCVDDKKSALEHSERSSRESAYYRELVSEREIDKYFEFKRVYAKDKDDVILSRVYKCSYYDPIQNKLKVKPVTPNDVTEFTEMKWYENNYNRVGANVIYSNTSLVENYYLNTIYYTRSSFFEAGPHITVDLIKQDTRVSKVDGKIHISEQTVKSAAGECK